MASRMMYASSFDSMAAFCLNERLRSESARVDVEVIRTFRGAFRWRNEGFYDCVTRIFTSANASFISCDHCWLCVQSRHCRNAELLIDPNQKISWSSSINVTSSQL